MSDQDEHERDLDDEVEEIRFPLSKPFKYHTKSGGEARATWIELSAPTTRNSREIAALEQSFLRAANSQADGDDGDKGDPGSGVTVEGDSKGPDPIGIVAVIAMSQEDFPAVLEVAKKLFASGVAQVEGETKLTSNLIEKMANKDLERMLGVYLLNFTLASSLARPQTTTPQS